jgi:hypothetical protein
MHDIRAIREDPDLYRANLRRREAGKTKSALALFGEIFNAEESDSIGDILKIDERLRGIKESLQLLRAQRNSKSKEVGIIKAAGGDAAGLMDEVAALKARMADLEGQEREAGAKLQALLEGLPNLLDPDVPDGADEGDNVEVASYIPPPRRGGSASDIPPPRRGGGQGGVTAAGGEGGGGGRPRPPPPPARGGRGGGPRPPPPPLLAGSTPPHPPPARRGGRCARHSPPSERGGLGGGHGTLRHHPPPFPPWQGGGSFPPAPTTWRLGSGWALWTSGPPRRCPARGLWS